MDNHEPDDRYADTSPGMFAGWVYRRRERIRAEVERNRSGNPAVPTWVLAVILVVIVVGWATLVILS
jgi:hypothetical protein